MVDRYPSTHRSMKGWYTPTRDTGRQSLTSQVPPPTVAHPTPEPPAQSKELDSRRAMDACRRLASIPATRAIMPSLTKTST